MKTINKSKKGFTLIELLIVVVIIGILAAIAIPNFISMVNRAKDAAVRSNMHTLQVTVENFATYTDGSYPGGLGNDVNTIRDAAGLGGLPEPNPGNIGVLVGMDAATGAQIADMNGDPNNGPSRLLPGNYNNPVRATNLAVSSPGKIGWAAGTEGVVSYEAYDAEGAAVTSGQAGVSYFIWGSGAKGPIPDSLSSGQ